VRDFFDTAGQPVVAAAEGLGIDGQLVAGWAFVLVLLAILVGTYLLIARLSASPFGRVLKGIRDDEEATQSLAKRTSSFKVRAFVIGCAVLGLLGIVWQGASSGYVTPSRFLPELTFFIWIAVIVGGAGSNTGTVVGTILFVGLVLEGPGQLRRVVEEFVGLSGSVPTFPDALGALGSGSVDPLLLYVFDQTSALRVVLTGLLLIWLLKRRPQGLFGDRREVASSIDLEERVQKRRGSGSEAQAQGGDAD
jgi:branched-chain amino acid transport system permease protein